MRRFHTEIALMRNRLERERFDHDGEDCRCLHALGFHRKHRPRESHGPNQHCFCCECERMEAKQARRRERYGAREMIALEMAG